DLRCAGLEDIAVNPGTKARPHHSRPDERAQDDDERLLHMLCAGSGRDHHVSRALAVEHVPARREGPALSHLGVVDGAHPIITVGAPTAIDAPHAHESPCRTAGRPWIITELDPATNGDDGKCPVLGGMTQACMSPMTAAGIPAIITVDTPGPTTVPPCTVVSPTRPAAGIVSPN